GLESGGGIAHREVHDGMIVEVARDASHGEIRSHGAIEDALTGFVGVELGDLRVVLPDSVPVTGAIGIKPEAVESAHDRLFVAPPLPVTIPASRFVEGVQFASRTGVRRDETSGCPWGALAVIQFVTHVGFYRGLLRCGQIWPGHRERVDD